LYRSSTRSGTRAIGRKRNRLVYSAAHGVWCGFINFEVKYTRDNVDFLFHGMYITVKIFIFV